MLKSSHTHPRPIEISIHDDYSRLHPLIYSDWNSNLIRELYSDWGVYIWSFFKFRLSCSSTSNRIRSVHVNPAYVWRNFFSTNQHWAHHYPPPGADHRWIPGLPVWEARPGHPHGHELLRRGPPRGRPAGVYLLGVEWYTKVTVRYVPLCLSHGSVCTSVKSLEKVTVRYVFRYSRFDLLNCIKQMPCMKKCMKIIKYNWESNR